MKKIISLLCVFLMVSSMSACATAPIEKDEVSNSMNAGTYTQTVNGMHGPITLSVTVDETTILNAEILEQMESPGVGDKAADLIANSIVENQSLDVDTIAGATITSRVVLYGITEALKQADANIEYLSTKKEREYAIDDTYTSDVVVVGGGGAGVMAAITALEQGSTVTIIEKTDIFGGNSILSGGFMNAVVPEIQDTLLDERSHAMESLVLDAIQEEPVSEEHAALQQMVKEEYEAYLLTDKTMFDSENFHALQTWNGGDKVADLDIVSTFAHGADDVQRWLIEQGLVFRDSMFMGGGALYSRSRYPDDQYPVGTGYFVLYDQLLEQYDESQLTVLMSTDAQELIENEDGAIIGVKANHTKSNKDIIVNANNGVILATGGFAGNVDLRVEYCQSEKWTDLGDSVLTTNTGSVTGDGILMAKEIGASLVNMEQIQLLPYCDPNTGIGSNTADRRGQDYLFINKEGKRFVREDGRRDDMSLAIMDQTDGAAYMFINTTMDYEDMKTQSGISVKYLVDNKISGYVYGETLEDIANEMNVPYETLRKTVEDFATAADADVADEFGRVTYATSIDLDGEFVAFLRAPAVHHTMGGIEIDTETRVLDTKGNIIDGLYAAGEITGNLHGANRLGGNAISDFLVFGKIAGTSASQNK